MSVLRDAALNDLRGKRRLAPRHCRPYWMRSNSYYFHDPDGNLVELWSPEDYREPTHRNRTDRP